MEHFIERSWPQFFWVLFFIISCKIRCKNGFNLFFYFFVNKDKEFWVTLNYKKNIMLWILDPWSRIHLSQRTSILHCRFSVCKHTHGAKLTEQNWYIFLSLWRNERRKTTNISHLLWLYRACSAWDGTEPGTWTLSIQDQRAGVCSRAKSYCCEKINVRGEVFKERDYTICTKNFHAVGQLKLKS